MDADRPLIFVACPLAPEAAARLSEYGEVDLWTEPFAIPHDELVARASRATALLTTVTDRVDGELLDKSPKLRVVSNVAVGYDNFDVAALTERGIPAGNTPGVLTEATADIAFGLLIAVARRIVESRDAILAGEWQKWTTNSFLGQELSGSTLGIVGMGRIGEAVARRARAFNMQLLAWSRTERPLEEVTWVGLDEIFEQSDFLSVHVALNANTYHLIGAELFAKMKPTAIIINTARGAVIDQAALVDALDRGVIGGAGLDVFEQEPIPRDDPLLSFKNVVAIPHIGSATTTTRRAMADLAVDNVIAGLRDEPLPHSVNPEVYLRR